jgi:RNA polymerase sigma factor (sigma-70 family)
MIAFSRDVVASPPPPTPSELKRIRSGDQQCCRDLIDCWEIPIKVIASRYVIRSSDLDDLVQVGRIAVYLAALNYKASFGFPFGNYTKRAIKNLVLKEADRLARQRRFETPLETNQKEHGWYQEELTADGACFEPIKEWVRELPEPHATIFRLLYVERLKQRQAAEQMGVSQPRVAQLHKSFLSVARETFVS